MPDPAVTEAPRVDRSANCSSPYRVVLRRLATLALLTAGLTSLGCRSELRGDWQGTFDGNVTGTVEMTINSRGTRCRGSMVGQTSSGQPFEAKLEGTLDRGLLNATFRGSSQGGDGLPIRFSGELAGELLPGEDTVGAGRGRWQAEILLVRSPMGGTWTLEQGR